MEVISVQGMTAIARGAQILASGGVLLYPTDTLYGLGVDALSDVAVSKLYAIKGRDPKKPTHCIVADLGMVAEYGEVNDVAKRLAAEFLPGPLTLILKKKEGIDTGIARDIATIGIRIPDNDFCLALAQEFGKPFTTTSANKNAAKPEYSIEKILDQFGPDASKIDLAIDAGELPERSPSTIVDVSSGEAVILREGAISAALIQKALAVSQG